MRRYALNILVSVRGKLVLAFLIAALVPVTAYTVLVRLQTTAALSHAERTEAIRAIHSVEGLLKRLQRDDAALLARHLPAGTRGSVPSPGEVDGLRHALVRAATRSDGSMLFVQLVTDGGMCMVRGSLLRADALAGLRLTPGQVLEQPVSGVTAILNEPYIVSAATMRSRQRDRALVTVLLARPLDDNLLAEVASLTGTRVSLFVKGVLVAASHRDGNDGLEEYLAHRMVEGRIDVDDPWTLGYVGLGNGDELSLRVAVRRTPFSAASSSLSSASGWLIAAAVVIALVTALTVWRAFGRRLRALGGAARALTRGERPPRLDVAGDDDIAAVARSFNDMTTAVQSRFDDLTARLDSLTDCLADLNLVGETLASSPDVHGELSRVATMLRQMTSCDLAAFHLKLDGSPVREVVYAGDPGNCVEALDRLAGITAASVSSVYSGEIGVDDRLPRDLLTGRPDLRSARSLPLIHQRRVLGTVTIASREPRRFQGRSATMLATVASQTALALSQAQTYQELERSYLETVSALLAALEAMDAYTADHGGSLMDLVLAVGEELRLERGQLRRMRFAAALHDIGKIGVPTEILRKPGPLTHEERLIMERHTVIGERIVARIHYLEPIARIIRSAHERWDGKGYPDRLRGKDIPLESRIVFVCDAYHAMTSDRTYRRGMSEDEALEELRLNAGTQFDPDIVDAFCRSAERVVVLRIPDPARNGEDDLVFEPLGCGDD